jgi:ABC-type lipoprotein export system ATPase subunit
MTILMVTHDPVVAERCLRVVRLKDGLIEYDRQQPGYRGRKTAASDLANLGASDAVRSPAQSH